MASRIKKRTDVDGIDWGEGENITPKLLVPKNKIQRECKLASGQSALRE